MEQVAFSTHIGHTCEAASIHVHVCEGGCLHAIVCNNKYISAFHMYAL